MIRYISIAFLILVSVCSASLCADFGGMVDALAAGQKCIVLVADFKTGDILACSNNIDDGGQYYAPGSTIKLLLSILLIKSGTGEDMKVNCFASSPEEPIEERCWDVRGHGIQDFPHAFANSCNRFFLKASARLDEDSFRSLMDEFVLEDAAAAHGKITPGDMIGLGTKLAVKPADLLAAYMSVLSGGILYRWYEMRPGGAPSVNKSVNISRAVSDRIKELMTGTTVFGTASEAAGKFGLEPFPAKTGTAYYSYGGVPDYKKTHGWFIGFYPGADTKIAVLVFVLEGKGTKEASLLGAEIIDLFRKNYK